MSGSLPLDVPRVARKVDAEVAMLLDKASEACRAGALREAITALSDLGDVQATEIRRMRAAYATLRQRQDEEPAPPTPGQLTKLEVALLRAFGELEQRIA